ncbi:MAG: WYL domain-containing protein [Planctomycetota bacterium]|nr:MAG: WYL domain-containing protein [Planctomycetota bacterium]
MKAEAIRRQRMILMALCGYSYYSINDLGDHLAQKGIFADWFTASAAVLAKQRRMVERDITKIDRALRANGRDCWLDHRHTTPEHGGKPVHTWRIRAHAGLPVMDEHGRIGDLCEQQTLAAMHAMIACVDTGPLAQSVQRVLNDRYGHPASTPEAIAFALCSKGHGVQARHVERLLKVCWRNDYQHHHRGRDGYRRCIHLHHSDGSRTTMLPLRLVIAGDGWKVLGWLPRVDGIRAVALAGLTDLHKDQPPREPPHHQLCKQLADRTIAASFSGSCGEDAITNVTLLVSQELWQREQGRHWGDQVDHTQTRDGVRLQLHTSAPRTLAAWVAGQAGEVTVLDPPTLHEEVTHRVHSALAKIRNTER